LIALGWTIIGPTEIIGQEDSFKMSFLRLETQDDDETLSQQVEKFWKTDSWRPQTATTEEDFST